jgi:hypothetical protein
MVITAAYGRITGRYGERGIRYAHMEVGHVGQNLHLQAEALGSGTVVIGAFSPEFPGRFGSLPDAGGFCSTFFDYYNHEHRHSSLGWHTPGSVHFGTAPEIRERRAAALTAAYAAHPERFARAADATQAAHGRQDQRAPEGGDPRSLITWPIVSRGLTNSAAPVAKTHKKTETPELRY